MKNDDIRTMAESVIAEAFSTIAYGIVPSSDDKDERELAVYQSCGEVLASRYIESGASDSPMTVDDAINVCKEIGMLLCHKEVGE